MQNAGPIATRLDMFRTSTLAAFEPVDEQKNTSNVEIEDLFDSSVALENFVISELPIVNSRAGLYIYLNAVVSTWSLLTVKMLTIIFIEARWTATDRRYVHLQLSEQQISGNAKWHYVMRKC